MRCSICKAEFQASGFMSVFQRKCSECLSHLAAEDGPADRQKEQARKDRIRASRERIQESLSQQEPQVLTQIRQKQEDLEEKKAEILANQKKVSDTMLSAKTQMQKLIVLNESAKLRDIFGKMATVVPQFRDKIEYAIRIDLAVILKEGVKVDGDISDLELLTIIPFCLANPQVDDETFLWVVKSILMPDAGGMPEQTKAQVLNIGREFIGGVDEEESGLDFLEQNGGFLVLKYADALDKHFSSTIAPQLKDIYIKMSELISNADHNISKEEEKYMARVKELVLRS